MLRVILSGCAGAMGRAVTAAAAEREDIKIVAGIDPGTPSEPGYPVFSELSNCNTEADVIIDFSHPAALPGLLEYAGECGLPIVLATTGYSEAQVALIRERSASLPIFYTGNMSLGINLMQELCRIAARVLGGQFDVEIIEKHHNKKIDAPSGTALMLAESVSSQLKNPSRYEYNRHSKRERRSSGEIGIHSVRGGTIVGVHDVIFAGQDEILTISHTAMSKNVFAQGALSAALYMRGQASGLYNMGDLIG